MSLILYSAPNDPDTAISDALIEVWFTTIGLALGGVEKMIALRVPMGSAFNRFPEIVPPMRSWLVTLYATEPPNAVAVKSADPLIGNRTKLPGELGMGRGAKLKVSW